MSFWGSRKGCDADSVSMHALITKRIQRIQEMNGAKNSGFNLIFYHVSFSYLSVCWYEKHIFLSYVPWHHKPYSKVSGDAITNAI